MDNVKKVDIETTTFISAEAESEAENLIKIKYIAID